MWLLDKTESEGLEEFIDKNIKPVLLLNTHCHLDHIFGNRFILEKYGLRTFSSEIDEMNRKNAVQHALLFGLTMENRLNPQDLLSDNQKITFGTTELLAFSVPGHTPGSLAFYSENNECVFTGDALFCRQYRKDRPSGWRL